MAVSLAPTRAPEARSHAQPAGARPDGLTVLRSESPSPPLLQLAPSPWVAKLAGLSSPWVALPPLASPASFSSHVYVTEPRESISYLHTQCITVTRAQSAGWRVAGTEGSQGRQLGWIWRDRRGSPPARLELRAALFALEDRGVTLDGSVPHLPTTHPTAAAAVNAARSQRARVEPIVESLRVGDFGQGGYSCARPLMGL